MKKLLFFLMFPSVCFGAGTVTVKQGSSGGGNLTIQSSSGSGSGTITTGNGLLGDGSSGNPARVNPSTVTVQGTFVAGTNVTLIPSAGFTTISAIGGGGGGGSPLAVGTGTAANFTNQVSSPTNNLSFLGSHFLDTTSGTTNFVALNGSSVTLQGVFVAGTNVTLTPSAGFMTISSTASFPAQSTIISTMTVGATNFVFNQVASTQSNSGFNVTTGVVTGIFSVVQPDDDTGFGPVTLKTLTTQFSASSMYHSLFLYGVVPQISTQDGEFIITTATSTISNPGSFDDRTGRPEIALVPTGSQAGQGIALRGRAHQLPDTSPFGDFVVNPGTNTSFSPLYIRPQPTASNPSLNLFDSHSKYSGFVASQTVTTNAIWVLPPADGLSGQVLTTDGNQNFYFSTPTVGSSISVYNATATVGMPFGFSASTGAFTSSVTVQGALSVGTTTAIGNLKAQVHIVTPDGRVGLVVQDPPASDGGSGTGSTDLVEFWDHNGLVLSSVTASGAFVTGSSVTAYSMILKGQPAGVAHVVAASSQIVSGLVSLSTEVTGSLPAASIAAGSLGNQVLVSSLPATVPVGYSLQFTTIATPSGTEGQMWADGPTNSIANFTGGIINRHGVIFTSTAQFNLASSAVATTMTVTNPGGVGTLTLPANFFRPGKMLEIGAYGNIQSASNPNLTFQIKLGTVTILTTGARNITPGNSSLSTAVLDIRANITCYTTGSFAATAGTVYGYASVIVSTASSTPSPMTQYMLGQTTTTAIDTTVSNTINLVFTWGTSSSSNIVQIGNFYIKEDD